MAENQQTPDPNMFTTPFMLTKSMHRDVYPSIDPKNGELSAKGKVVIITGAGGGIGYAIAKAWSDAEAAGIVLVGRDATKLNSTAEALTAKSLVRLANIIKKADALSVFEKAVAEFGHVDVLINAAGTMNDGAMIGQVDPDDWWLDFESNVRGTYNMAHAFVKATGGKGTIINVVSLGASFVIPGISSYSASKLAATKLTEFLDVEFPDLRVFSIHPGIVPAVDGRGMAAPAFLPFAHDKPALTGGVTLYLSTSRSDFLRGGFLSVNWDVEELEANKREFTEKKLNKLAFLIGQLQPGGYAWKSV